MSASKSKPAKVTAPALPPTAAEVAQAEAEKVARKHAHVMGGLAILFDAQRDQLAGLYARIAPALAATGASDSDAMFEVRGKFAQISNLNPAVLARAIATLDAVAIVLPSLRQGASVQDVLDCTVEPRLSEVIRDGKAAEAWAWMEVRKACTPKYF